MKNAAQRINDNFFKHSWKLTSQVPGMQVFLTESMSISDCGLSCDTFNIIYIRHPEKLRLQELQKAISYFKEKNTAYTVWIEDNSLATSTRELLNAANLEVTNREPGMLLPLHSYSPPRNEAYQAIRKVTTPEQLEQFSAIVASNWQPPDQNVVAYYSKAGATIFNPNSPAAYYVYYHSAKPVAAVELFISDKQTAGIFSLSTLEAYRGKGIGSTLFTYALNEAITAGCQYAVLQASEDGISIYQRLGFSTETHFIELHTP